MRRIALALVYAGLLLTSLAVLPIAIALDVRDQLLDRP